jgi:Protein of unknown function (DUF1822)
MTYNSDELKQLNNLWKTIEAEAVELQFQIPDGPQFPQGAVPIPSTARQKAAGMADLCRHVDRRERMRHNLLATIAVHDYLKLQGYLLDLEASDCRNPILGRMGEVADLVVSQVGQFECCAIKPGELTCSVPAEGQFGRSGYVVVEMDAEERWGWLLGFLPAGEASNPIEMLNREGLQSMDEFGYLLHRLWLLWNIVRAGSEPWDVELRAEMVALLERNYWTRSAAQRSMRAAAEMTKLWGEEVTGAEPRELAGMTSREGDSPNQPELQQFLREVFDRLEDVLEMEAEADNGKPVNLGQWLNNRIEESRIRLEELTPAFRWVENQVEEGWQNLEALFSAEELIAAVSMRSPFMERGKLIRLTTEVTQQTIVLIMKLNPQSEKDTNIIVEVRPQSGQLYLPEKLQIKVLNDQQKAVMEAIASRTNQNIQFDFNIVCGERFSVQLILGVNSVIEEFVV